MSKLEKTGAEEGTFRDVFKGKVNVEHKAVYSQIRQNIRRILPQVQPHPPNNYKVALLCGGPSLNKAKIPRGYKIATVNNTYNWALERGHKPSVYVQLDAREFNNRFVSEPLSSCKYLLCSQVHPSTYDRLEGYDVRVWHGAGAPEKKILDKYYMRRWVNIQGGSTAGTRAIYLLYLLGMRTIRVYGMDSSFGSVKSHEHHAYAQPENDMDATVTVRVGRRRFRSTVWMVAQVDEFLQMAGHFPDNLKLSFEGDGLLQYVVQQTAKRGRIPRIVLE